MLGYSGAMDRGSGYSQGALREQEVVLTLEAMKTEEDDGGGGNLEERDDSQEDRRRAPVQLFWVRIKGAGWAFVGRGWVPVRQTVSSGWLLGVGCWLLQRFAGCLVVWLSGLWLSGWQGKTGRPRGSRGGEGESEQKEKTGVGGADEGGRQGRRAEPPEGPWWSRAEQAGQRSAAQRCARCRCPCLVLSAPVVREQ
jgi:hypothetical protein